jgi:hypothetical protein
MECELLHTDIGQKYNVSTSLKVYRITLFATNSEKTLQCYVLTERGQSVERVNDVC